MSEALVVTTSPRDDHQLDLQIQLGPERTEQALQRAVRVVSKKAKIPGFRPGKAPFATVVRLFGREALLGEILDDLGQEVYAEVMETEKLDTYGRAALSDVETDPLVFKLVVPLPPKVELGDYSALQIKPEPVEVGEADVEAVLERALDAEATLVTVERPAALNDTVLVDIVGNVGENSIMDNHDWELLLKGGGGWLPGFDEAFVGLSAGEEKAFTLTYPEDSASKYKGQDVDFKVTVKEVRAKVRPEITDEFIEKLGDYTDLADFRTKKLDELTKGRAHEVESKLTESAVEALVEGASFAYPPIAVDDVVHEMIHDLESRVANIGYKLDDFLKLQGTTVQKYHDELEPQAERRLKGRLVLKEYARREGITVSDEEKQAELDRLAAGAESPETVARIREVFGSEAGLAVIERDLLTDKTLVRLRAMVTGAEPATETAS